MSSAKDIARAIFEDTLHAVDVRKAVREQIAVSSDTLTVAGQSVSLHDIDEVILIAIGKASMPMYQAAEEALRPASLFIRALVVAPAEFRQHVRGTFFAGGHPLPNNDSLLAADAALSLLQSATKTAAVLYLISGGTSAMIERPLDTSLTLEDLQQIYQALVASGLEIGAMNAIRKHISAVKGGRLAKAASHAAVQWSLLISDVPAAAPDVIGSGTSLPDSSTLAQSLDALAKAEMPAAVRERIRSALQMETPKSDDEVFQSAYWRVVLSSEHLAEAAAHAARAMGYEPFIDNACDEWEYREAAEYLLQRAASLAPKSCLISVGEVSVALPQQIGRGGRNQQFALYCALELPKLARNITVLSAGSDGMDGNSTNAGAIADHATVRMAAHNRIDAERILEAFDAASLFEALGDAVTTGPTGNNLRDLRLFLVD